MIPFILSLGAMLAAFAVAVGWLFRTARVHLLWRVALPSALVSLALWTPFQVSSLVGYPVSISMAAMPEDVQLVAYVPHDHDGTVDLWVIAQSPIPRAYQVPLTEGLKKTLREAGEKLRSGAPVRLKKQAGAGGGKPGAAYGASGPDDSPHYVVKDANLPAKP